MECTCRTAPHRTGFTAPGGAPVSQEGKFIYINSFYYTCYVMEQDYQHLQDAPVVSSQTGFTAPGGAPVSQEGKFIYMYSFSTHAM